MESRTTLDHCVCCGARSLAFSPVLWPQLIDEWRLAPHEVEYVDRQQGLHCALCGANLRSMALAAAIMLSYDATGTFRDFILSPSANGLRILEVNEAGGLSQYLAQHPGRTLARYPEVDMTAMPYGDEMFDLVVHSDTLEHVKRPVRALAECHRVLRRDGFCAFTIPMVVERLTRSREGMPLSFHGSPETEAVDWAVATEYGADAWRHVIEAGFLECRIMSLDYPAAQAFVCVRR